MRAGRPSSSRCSLNDSLTLAGGAGADAFGAGGVRDGASFDGDGASDVEAPMAIR